jgi:hypothetical protein
MPQIHEPNLPPASPADTGLLDQTQEGSFSGDHVLAVAEAHDGRSACALILALNHNGWDPSAPPSLKPGYYIDPAELFYRVIKVQMAGGIDKSGIDGLRFMDLVTLLANGYIGKISFRDTGDMANLHEDMVQEAITKCAAIVMKFSPWDSRDDRPVLNNAFAYFSTVIRNRYLETLKSPLRRSDFYLEDFRTETQSIGDLI